MEQEFRVVVKSPYGEKGPISQFEHWINKVSDEALTRWGIQIDISRVDDSDDVDRGEFE